MTAEPTVRDLVSEGRIEEAADLVTGEPEGGETTTLGAQFVGAVMQALTHMALGNVPDGTEVAILSNLANMARHRAGESLLVPESALRTPAIEETLRGLKERADSHRVKFDWDNGYVTGIRHAVQRVREAMGGGR